MPPGCPIISSSTQDTMLHRLPNGNLLYLQGHLTPYQAKKRMEEDAKRSTQKDGRNLFTEMFGDS